MFFNSAIKLMNSVAKAVTRRGRGPVPRGAVSTKTGRAGVMRESKTRQHALRHKDNCKHLHTHYMGKSNKGWLFFCKQCLHTIDTDKLEMPYTQNQREIDFYEGRTDTPPPWLSPDMIKGVRPDLQVSN